MARPSSIVSGLCSSKNGARVKRSHESRPFGDDVNSSCFRKDGMRPAVVILAAGRGTRMNPALSKAKRIDMVGRKGGVKSRLPKALQPVCGVPMLGALMRSAAALKPAKTVIVAGFGIEA